MIERIWRVVPLVLAGGALALAATDHMELQRRAKAPPAPPVAAPEPPEGTDDELEAKLGALEWAVHGLARRIEALEAARVQPAATAADVDAGTPAVDPGMMALRRDVDALYAAEAVDSEHGREHLKSMLTELQGEIAADRARARQESRTAKVRKLAEDARLPQLQQERLVSLFEEEAQKRRELRDQMRSGARPRDDVARELASLREKTDTEVRAMLPADALSQFEQLRRDGSRQQPGARPRAETASPSPAGAASSGDARGGRRRGGRPGAE